MKSLFKKLTKQHRIAIACSITGIILVIIASVAVFLFGPGKHISVSSENQSSMTENTASASETTVEEASETESTTESTTPSATKPPAAPVVKPYKPKTKPSAPKVQKKPTKSVQLNVPVVYQNPDYPTGCEGASATMLLKYYGYRVSIDEVMNAIPREDLYEENGRVYGPSIYEKFVGDPRNTHTDDRPGYGAFSPVITRSLNTVIAQKRGRHTAKNITGCSFQNLLDHLDDGDPIIVWATDKMKTPTSVNSWYIKQENGEDKYFEYPRGTHVMVLSGYDGSYVYITDPGYGKVKYTYSAFNDKWVLLGRQAIILTDSVIQTTESTAPVTDAATEPSKEPVTEPSSSTETTRPEETSAEETTRLEETSAETSATTSVPEESTGQDLAPI